MDDFLPSNGIEWQGDVGKVNYGPGDKGMVVMFYWKPVHQPGPSMSEGRQVFKDEVYVRIHPPGERLNIVDRPANRADANRWPLQYQQFKMNQEQAPEGTPIEQLYPDRPSVAATLRAYGVHTIEACAELSGNAIDTIGMGAQHYCNDARKYIEVAKRGVGAAEMRKELEDRDRKIERLERDNATLRAQVDALVAKQQEGVSLDQVQSLIASVMQRPVIMPGVTADPQAAMINANHKTADIRATDLRTGKVAPKQEAPKVRTRTRS